MWTTRDIRCIKSTTTLSGCYGNTKVIQATCTILGKTGQCVVNVSSHNSNRALTVKYRLLKYYVLWSYKIQVSHLKVKHFESL